MARFYGGRLGSIIFLAVLFSFAALVYLQGTLAKRARRMAAVRDVQAGTDWVVGEATAWGAERYEVTWGTKSTDVVVHLRGPSLCLDVSVRGKATRAEGMREAARMLAAQRSARSGGVGARDTRSREGQEPPRQHVAQPPDRDWRDVLGVGPDAGLSEATGAWRAHAFRNHPDRGGTVEAMARFNGAMAEARKELA